HYVGVDVGRFRPTGLHSRDPIVLFVGRLVANKGVQFIIEALRALIVEIPGLQGVIIGDGPERDALKRAAAGLPAVQFLGTVPPATVRAWMGRAKVLCAPSVTIR